MTKFRIGCLVDDLFPSHQVNELIEFVDFKECFDNPVLITGYQKIHKHESTLRKLTAKFQQGPF